MDQKTSQFHSSSQNQPTTFTKGVILSKFARSWLELEDNKLQDAKLDPTSLNFTIPFQGTLEFCGVLEVTGSDGYFMVNSSIRLKSDEDTHDGPLGIVDCSCLVEVRISEDVTRGFCAKGSFQSQIYKGKDSTGSVRFMAKEFLDKVSTLYTWHLCVSSKIQLSMATSTQWKSLGMVRPGRGMEPPFLAAFRSKAFADVTIECDGRKFQAHKNVLSCASPVFARMLASSAGEHSTKTIKIDDQDSSTIERMLDFIYTGNFTRLPDDALVDQLYCAEKYDLEDLKAAAALHMVLTVSDFNVMKFLNAAMKCKVSRDVVDKLMQHCKSNFQSLSIMGGVKEFFAKHFDQFFGNNRVPTTQREVARESVQSTKLAIPGFLNEVY